MHSNTRRKKITFFIFALGLTLFFIYGFLPFLTRHIPILQEMSLVLEKKGIDPSRYYYTDVKQVKEAEQHIRSVLEDVEK